jgi:uncharacterized protein (DUF362 family)
MKRTREGNRKGISMLTSVVYDKSLQYPDSDEFFSPDRAWPEYRLEHLARRPNPVYGAVRQCFADAGLDEEHFDQPTWNPLGRYISPGNRVFLLCNFVQHKVRSTTSEVAFFAKCTHGSVIRAVMDYVLVALKGNGSIAFGNAPLQGCKWQQVIQQSGAKRVEEFYAKFNSEGIGVSLVDLRQHIMRRGILGGVTTAFHNDGGDHSVEVELGTDSLLDHLYSSGPPPRFRVLDYDPRRIERCHQKGRHTYIMNRRILESDVIISIPKLKTHEKVGITCGIKGCVGTVAHKDCLAHHRYGPPKRNGDEFPDKFAALEYISAIHDRAYSREAGPIQNVLHSADRFSRRVICRFTRTLSGAWPGNDTCWRMAVDLARIVKYADKTGKMRTDTQRTHLLFTDGIIGGEGNGPLSPRPVPLGYLSFSDDVVIGDYVNALAMGFDPRKIPMLREAVKLNKYPLTDADPSQVVIRFNGRAVPIDTLQQQLGKKFLPPREWRQAL